MARRRIGLAIAFSLISAIPAFAQEKCGGGDPMTLPSIGDVKEGPYDVVYSEIYQTEQAIAIGVSGLDYTEACYEKDIRWNEGMAAMERSWIAKGSNDPDLPGLIQTQLKTAEDDRKAEADLPAGVAALNKAFHDIAVAFCSRNDIANPSGCRLFVNFKARIPFSAPIR